MEAPTGTFSNGQRVLVAGRKGVVRFCGTTEFAAGIWVGVELDDPVGKNNGTVKDVSYFTCPPERGIFVRPPNVTLDDGPPPSPTRASRTSSAAALPRGSTSSTGSGRASTSSATGSPPVTPAASASPTAAVTIPATPKASTATAGTAPTVAPRASSVSGDAAPAQPTSPSQAGLPSPTQAAKAAPVAPRPLQQPVTPTAADAPSSSSPAAAGPDPAELAQLRSKVTQLRQELEAKRSEASSAKKQLADAEQRCNTAKAALGGAEPKEQERLAAEKLEKAQASRNLLKAAVDKTRGQMGMLRQINKQLEQRQDGETVEDLRSQLQATELSRVLQEEKLGELQLELAELDLQLEERAEMLAKKACTKGAVPAKTLEYQAAIRILFTASSEEAGELRDCVAELDKACSFEANLRHEQQALTERQDKLHVEITDLEQKESELAHLAKAGQLLHETQADIVQELRRELERCDSRVEELEDLVQRLYREWQEVESAIAKDAGQAAQLLEQVQVVATEATQGDEVLSSAAVQHARQAAADVKRRLADLSSAASTARAEAFAGCIPEAWLPPQKGKEAGKGSLQKVLAKAELVSRAERCLCQAASLAAHQQSTLLTMRSTDPSLSKRAQLSLASWRCAGAVAMTLDAVSSSTGAVQGGLEDVCTESEKKLGALLDDARSHNDLAPEVVGTLREVEQGFLALTASGEDPPTATSQRVAAFHLRSLEVAFSFNMIAAANPAEEEPEPAPEVTKLKANGCVHPVIGPILTGDYSRQGENHGMPVFVKDEKAGDDDVNLYFWDESNGPENSGWWFAPVIGGDAVWAFAPGNGTPQPPETGWRIPYDGDLDGDFSIVALPEEDAAPAVRVLSTSEVSDAISRLGRLATWLEVSTGVGEVKADASSLLASLSRPVQDFETALGTSTKCALESLSVAHSDVEKALDALERTRSVTARSRRTPSDMVPNWAACAQDTASDVEAVFETMQLVARTEAKIQEQECSLNEVEQQLAKASEHRSELEKKLNPFCEQAEKSAELDAEAEQLRQEVRRCASLQATLTQEVDAVRTCREQQEQVGQQASKKREDLEKNLDRLRRGPSKEGEVRATAQEYAALRLASEKGARDLYALQVGAVASLSPLPAMEPPKPCGHAIDTCMSKYADVRHDLILEMSRTRVTRLQGPLQSNAAGDKGSRVVAAQVNRIQQLQMKLAEVRGAAEPLAKAPTPKETLPSGTPVLELQVGLPCPGWAGLAGGKAKSKLSVTFGELCAIHEAMA